MFAGYPHLKHPPLQSPLHPVTLHDKEGLMGPLKPSAVLSREELQFQPRKPTTRLTFS